MTKHKATVGTLSHGTVRSADLIPTFVSEAEYQGIEDERLTEAQALIATAGDGEEYDESVFDSEEASEVLASLFDLLEETAPAYCYFGAHEGDGADYGYWPSMEAIEGLERIADPSEAGTPESPTADDVLFVNDHGNVTVYSATGAVVLELV